MIWLNIRPKGLQYAFMYLILIYINELPAQIQVISIHFRLLTDLV